MKKMMMALAALCVAGAASAVTVDWGSPLSKNDDGTYSLSKTIAGATSTTEGTTNVAAIKVVMNVTVADTPEGWPGYLLQIGGKPQGVDTYSGIGIYFGLDSAGMIVEGGSTNKRADTGVTLTSGQHEFIFAIERNGNTMTATVFIDGKQAVVYSNNNFGGFWMTDLVVGADLNGGNSLKGGFSISGDPQIYFADGVTAADLVPEPTALALLALGVAGLALRRKAA